MGSSFGQEGVRFCAAPVASPALGLGAVVAGYLGKKMAPGPLDLGHLSIMDVQDRVRDGCLGSKADSTFITASCTVRSTANACDCVSQY
jgi:hypothetical protein